MPKPIDFDFYNDNPPTSILEERERNFEDKIGLNDTSNLALEWGFEI